MKPAPTFDEIPPTAREAAVREEIRLWTGTQWPKNCRVGSARWTNGLTRRILTRLDQLAKEQKGDTQ